MNTPLEWKPTKALVFYRNHEGSSSYIQVHEITNNRLEAGLPLTQESYEKLIRTVIRKKSKKSIAVCNSIIERRIIHINQNVNKLQLTWIIPEADSSYHTKKKTKTIRYPQMIMKWNGSEMSVFAIDKNIEDENAKIYHLPFPNISAKGDVCLGNAKVKKYKTINETINHAEELFFKTNFLGEGRNIKKFVPGQPFNYELLRLYGNRESFYNTILSD